ncbi:MAG: MiaB/RimO family radical SAM methylthiotransferase [Candidatus Omnitrophota bacterium]|nr:MiaB/RimO family radical SAM methylthiotransferase [Candidatus Omnitrophota bacterium]
MPKKKFSIVSLGCFRNTYDSGIVAEKFLRKGYSFMAESRSLAKNTNEFAGCDVLGINTCGFIDKAKKESLAAIKEAIQLKNRGKIKKILVFGCLVERYRKDLEKFFPEVNQWRGVEKLSCKFIKRKNLLPRYIDFLKICEGCFNKCSYCAIPLIKGSLVSKPKAEIVKEAKYLDSRGVKELNIIGQDITSWGRDLKGKEGLGLLLKKILQETKNIHWIRLFYTHPLHISGSLLDLIAKEERICKYIDLPLQHINDRILRLMNRKITKSETIDLIKKIRKKIPGCAIRTSIITGFPTETEREFEELLNFLQEMRFERLGTFIYSREENTAAYNLSGQLHYKTKERRLKEIMSLQQSISRDINRGFLGKEIEVLVEEKENDIFRGRSQYDGYEVDGVVYLKRKNLKIGEFYKVKIVDSYEYDLVGV